MSSKTFLALAVVAGGMIAAAAHGGLSYNASPLIQHASHGKSGHPRITYGEATYLCCASFSALVKASPVIVLARVVAQSPSFSLPATTGTLDTSPQPTIDPSIMPPVKATAIAKVRAQGPAATGAPANVPPLILTDSTVQVIAAMKGPVARGQQLTIIQPGGTYQGWQTIDRESPLLTVGTTEVLFLIPPTPGGSPHNEYQISVGAQARFRVQQNGLVAPLAMDYAYLSPYNNVTLNQLNAAVRADS